MDNPIAYCGLNCEKCDARMATLKDDNDLRALVAKKWSEMNHTTILPEMIQCLGCKGEGGKCYYCSNMCEIRKCAMAHGYENCGACSDMQKCAKLAPFIENNEEVLKNLTS